MGLPVQAPRWCLEYVDELGPTSPREVVHLQGTIWDAGVHHVADGAEEVGEGAGLRVEVVGRAFR